MLLLKSANGIVGWRPVLRNSSLPTYGWDGSCRMGPAPESGGRNPSEIMTQLTAGLGPNSGPGTVAASARSVTTDAARKNMQFDARDIPSSNLSIERRAVTRVRVPETRSV